MNRISWDECWMAVARTVALRSACESQVGAVIVSSRRRVIATGYNGPPAGYQVGGRDFACADCPHRQAVERGEIAPGDMRHHLCPSLHAEANALLYCQRLDREGSTIYITRAPCLECAKLIAQSGAERCVWVPWPSDLATIATESRKLLADSGVNVDHITEMR